MRRRRVALPALALAIAGPAHAADPLPPFRPTRDVDVTYRVPVPDTQQRPTALLQRLRWSAATERERLDLPTAGDWVVLDTRAGRIAMVRDAARAAIDLPAPSDGLMPGAVAAGARRAGDETVAGLACTDWQTTDTRGAPTTTCTTADGVMLRASSGGRVLLEAIEVKYAPQDASVFEVPAGYQRTSR